MKKLLQLLNEYEMVIGTDRVWGGAIDDGTFFCTRTSKKGNLIVQYSSEDEAILRIISKKFGFVKWLVDNDRTLPINPLHGYSKTNRVIITLAVKDDPISFLVSVLK